MKVLVIQPKIGMGDMVIYLPYIHAISKKYKTAVSILVKENSRANQLLAEDRHIKEILILDRTKNNTGTHDGLSGFFKLSKDLKLKEFDVRVINASVSGDTTSGGLNRLNWLIEGKDIDIVVLCLGANDMLRGISPILVRQNLNKILETLTEKKITVLFAGMIAQEAFGQKYKKEFDKIYPELAKKFNVSFLPFLLDGVALNPELNLKDGKHPNAEGINLISKNLEKKLINLLRN